MKKYKLIKEYPDSLKKGTIVSKDQLGNYITEKPLFIIESIVVENYPEFWEEVKGFGDVKTSFNLGEPLFTTADGLKIYRGQDVTLYIIDGEGYKTVDVENFNEEDAKVAERYKCFSNKIFLAEQIEQNKIKPILITNDGKRIYEESEKIYAVLTKANWAQEKIPAYNATYRNEDWKYFSTSEARINYIKQNKPTISIADIEKAYTWDKSAPLYIDFINNLKRIVGE